MVPMILWLMIYPRAAGRRRRRKCGQIRNRCCSSLVSPAVTNIPCRVPALLSAEAHDAVWLPSVIPQALRHASHLHSLAGLCEFGASCQDLSSTCYTAVKQYHVSCSRSPNRHSYCCCFSWIQTENKGTRP
ncbi:unnamed protein product [Ectocarpus sp. 13 AM-2016]